MELYTKFESRSSRSKAIAFHPTRPWVLVGLYSSTIQLWDYRMGWIVDRFEGHQGPVRGLDVHPTQQMFVSCGDDQLVRVWSLAERRLLFTLEGHQDYVRTAFFHPELPWIVTASDDQTVRIWDWQARKEIACLTGHSHWVSCAVFHPSEDLIVSSSLDCTVRAWDISGLRRKHSAAGMIPPSVPNFQNLPNQVDPFNDLVVTKFILEGHDRGVTWVACHPTQPLIVSSSDDRTLKVWRMSESRAWEIDTCRGHRDEVTGCAFDVRANVIISCSADETLRTWVLNKRTPLATFRRPQTADQTDRYWGVFLHPTLNLVGAALDSGATVFKLSYERPAYTTNPLTYVDGDFVLRNQDGPLFSVVQELNGQPTPPRTVSFNPAEQCYLLSYVSGSNASGSGTTVVDSSYARGIGTIVCFKNGKEMFKLDGTNALFVSRNRFVSLANNQLELRDMEGRVTKTAEVPFTVKKLAQTPLQYHVLLLGEKSVALFDLQQRIVVARLTSAEIRRAVWSPNGEHVALLSKHDIVVANNKLEQVTKLFETIRVKDLAWDAKLPVVVYSTFSHLKYGLLNGDTGVLCTLDRIHYVPNADGQQITLLSRTGELSLKLIDPTEYRFKLALISKNFGEVARLIETSQLVGQSIIAYLQQRGYPEIALEFVQDPKSRLDLAVEAGDLVAAKEAASQLQGPEFDAVLGRAALEQGNMQILEDVLQRQQDVDRLQFLYTATGNRSKLQRLEQLAMHKNDGSQQFETSLLLNSSENRVSLLLRAGMPALAYAASKSAGVEMDAEVEVPENAKITTFGKLCPPQAVNQLMNWPVTERKGVNIAQWANSTDSEVVVTKSEAVEAETVADEDAWDLELEEMPETEEVDSTVPQWVSSSVGSRLPADHIALGEFESAAQLLSHQIGAVKFECLKQRFFDVYEAGKLLVPGHDGLAPVEARVLAGNSPYIPGLTLLEPLMNEAFAQVKANQLELAIDTFRSVLHTGATLAVGDASEEQRVKDVIKLCRNYILAFSIEVKRRALPASETNQNVNLAGYFTVPKLKPSHAVLPLRTATVQAANAKDYRLASFFASKYLELDSTGPAAQKMAANKKRWDAAPGQTLDIAFDPSTHKTALIDPISLEPIFDTDPTVYELLTRTKYHAKHKGRVCAITGFTEIGAAGPGLMLKR